MESNEESNQPDDSINTNCKFTAVRLDLRHLTSSGHHGPRSHVFVISDDTSGLEVKRMVAEKIGLSDDDVASQMELIATSDLKSPEKKGNAKSEYLVADDSCLLDVYRVSPDRRPTVSFSLKWRNELKPSKSSYMSPSILHNLNSTPDQDLYPEQISETTDRKSIDRISYTNGSNIPGYRKTGNFPTVDLGPMDNPVKRLHSSSSSTSSWRSDRSKNECIIQYEPQNISSKTDLRISNFHSMADPELRTTTSSRPTSYDGHLKTPRTSKSLETGSYGSPLISSTTRSSHDPQNSNNSIIRLPAAGSLTRGERNSLDDAVGISSSFQTFCPVVPPGKTTSGDADQGGDQRETKFSSLPTMEQMTEAQRCRVGAHSSVSQAASSSSLPCISTTEGGLVGVGRRCLPQLCIPEEIVEEKRNLLSKRLEKKLQSADRKKKLRRRRSDMTQRNVAGALHSPNGRIDGNEEERRRRVSAGDNESDDDDCKSVTSWEVAEILASADPMAPQDSDYEDSPPLTDDDNVTSVFKTCRVTTSSPSDADTLDGSSNEADKRDEPPNDFSPIQRYARSSAPNVQSKLDFRSHLTSENHVASVKPVAISNKTLQAADLHTTANNSIPANSIRVIKNPTKASPTTGLSLFKLLRNGDFRFRTSVLCQSRRLSSAVRKLDRLPFEIFNDVIQVNSAQKGSVREKFTVPVIGDSTEEPDWECMEGGIETGDIVVEVNGHLVLNRPSSEVMTYCLSSSKNLQFLLARQRRTKK